MVSTFNNESAVSMSFRYRYSSQVVITARKAAATFFTDNS
ncbi:MAG: hypothetical protein ACI90A_000505, partial [Shewanella sp.]